MNKNIVIVDFKRTPFCEFIGSKKAGDGTKSGKLADFSAPQLAAMAARGVLKATGFPINEIDHIVLGLAEQNHNDDFYGGRYTALELGLIEVPALTVARICGSGAEAVVQAARMLMIGEADFILAAGAESLSHSPHVLRGLRQGVRLMQPPPLEDLFQSHLYDRFAGLMMGGTANKLGQRLSVTRQMCDEFALESIRRAHSAKLDHYFNNEIVPIEVTSSQEIVDYDDHLHWPTSLEELLALPPVPLFGDKKKGLVTAANASGMVDGAGAMLITTSELAASNGLQPIGRIVAWGIAAVHPDIMGFGPVPAVQQALKEANLQLSDLDVIELNEAFAAVAVADIMALDLRFPEKINPHGGAIALGHPLGGTGIRLIGTVLNHLRTQKKGSVGCATMCIGGGQGIAVIVEALN